MSTDTSTESTVAHATFVVERTFDAPARPGLGRVRHPRAARAVVRPGRELHRDRGLEDFRVGGGAVQDGQWHGGPTSRYVATYTDIVEQAADRVHLRHVGGRRAPLDVA